MEPLPQRTLHTWIGIAAATGFFLFFFFGDIFFALPRIQVYELFGSAVTSSQVATATQDFSSADEVVAPTPVGADDIVDHLSPPLNPHLAEFVGILDIVVGDGPVAEEGNAVQVGYIGSYIDEETGENVVFDSNTNPEDPLPFTIGSGQMIPGFDGGVVGMREGGQRLIRIEPEAGYGSEAKGSIPANTTLFFVVELYGVEK